MQGTTASKRDLNDPALRRMLAWTPAGADRPRRAAAGDGTADPGAHPAGLDRGTPRLAGPVLGLAAGPALAAAALRMARTAPINPAEPGFDTPMGTYYPWMITRALSLLLAFVAVYPALHAVQYGQLHGATVTGQLVLSAVVLGGYLMIASHQPR